MSLFGQTSSSDLLRLETSQSLYCCPGMACQSWVGRWRGEFKGSWEQSPLSLLNVPDCCKRIGYYRCIQMRAVLLQQELLSYKYLAVLAYENQLSKLTCYSLKYVDIIQCNINKNLEAVDGLECVLLCCLDFYRNSPVGLFASFFVQVLVCM